MAEEKEIIISVKADTSDAASGIDSLKEKITNVNNTPLDKPFKTFKAEIKEAVNNAKLLEEQFGRNSAEFANAAERVSELRERFQEFNQATQSFNPHNQLDSLVSASQGATESIAGLTGAFQFLGVESGTAEESIAKLQGLMAFKDALNSVHEIKESFVNLGTVIRANTVFQKLNAIANTVTAAAMRVLGVAATTTSTGFKILKGAIIGTGIGALVIGLIALVQNFDSVKKAVLNLIPGLSGIASFIGGIVDAVTDFVGITSEAGRATDKLVKDTEESIKKTEEFLDANGDKYDEYTQRKIKANLEYNKHLVEINKDETRKEEEKQALLKQFRDKADREIERATADRAKKIKDDTDKAIAEEKKKNDEKVRLAKEAADKQKSISDKAKAEEEKRQQNITDQDRKTSKLIEDARLAAIDDEFTRKQNALAVQSQEELDIQLVDLNKKLITTEEYEIRKKAIEDRYAELQSQLIIDKAKSDEEAALKAAAAVHESLVGDFTDKKTSSEAEVIKTTRENTVTDSDSPEAAQAKIQAVLEAKLQAETAAFQLEKVQKAGNDSELEALEQQHLTNVVNLNKEASDANLAIAQKEAEAKEALLASTATALNGLSDVVGKQTVAGKALAVASALISTYQGIAKGVSLGYPAAIPAVIIAAATGFLAVKNILSVKVPGKASSSSAPAGTSLSTAPIINAAATAQQNIQDVRVTNTGQQQPIRAYITDRDLQVNQKKNDFINTLTTI